MIIELGVNERRQIMHVVALRFLNILHSPIDIFAGLFVFRFLGAQFLLDSEILLLCLLHLRQRRVICETTVLQLLASRLVNIY